MNIRLPLVRPTDTTLDAALAYAAEGLYLLPVAPRDSKNPGSVVGKGWPGKSARDTEHLVAWFAGSADLLALHCGRSGIVAFDVDSPEKLPELLRQAITAADAPFQSTRPNQPGRGHYLFAVPPGRILGNSVGGLGKGWGEVRGRNGVIILSPSRSRYEWLRTGEIPVLPAEVADLLPDAADSADAATDAEVRRFERDHTDASNPHALAGPLGYFDRGVADGVSRHGLLVEIACWTAREARGGVYPARDAFAAVRERFVTATSTSRGGERTLTEPAARSEADGAIAYAIAQADALSAERLQERVAGALQSDRTSLESLIAPSTAPGPAGQSEPGRVPETGDGTVDAPGGDRPPDTPPRFRLIGGGSFIHDAPAKVPALWGRDDEVLWAQGEPLMITGPTGVGKTTLGSQVMAGRLGLLDEVLGYPVTPGRRVLYLAMDRPAQIARALGRLLRQFPRELLDDKLVVWPGPPPADLARHPGKLFELAVAADADTVIIDSIKDAAVKISDEEAGQGLNSAQQLCVANGVEVVAYHHQRKAVNGAGGGKPTSLSDVYGSAWLTAGQGSVVLLWGGAGDLIVELSHLKQPADRVGPFKLRHDHVAGRSYRTETVDILDLIIYPTTVREVAFQLSDGSGPAGDAAIEAARRKLDAAVSRGMAKKIPALPGGSTTYLRRSDTTDLMGVTAHFGPDQARAS